MTDRPYHHGDLREALVAAGTDAARTEGPSSIALRELARTIGVSPTAAYRHFPDLEHLVAAVSQRARQELASRMLAAMEAVTVTEPRERAWLRLLASGRAYIRFATDEPNLFATAFVPCTALPPGPDSPDAWSTLVGALDDLAALGELEPTLRTAAPVIAWSAVHGLSGILAATTPPPGLEPDPTIEAVLQAVARGLRVGPPGPDTGADLRADSGGEQTANQRGHLAG